jgi:hypothetical protein
VAVVAEVKLFVSAAAGKCGAMAVAVAVTVTVAFYDALMVHCR